MLNWMTDLKCKKCNHYDKSKYYKYSVCERCKDYSCFSQIVKEYHYSGPVYYFDDCIDPSWESSTYAISAKKAINNLAYRYKKSHNYSPNSKILLTGALKVIN